MSADPALQAALGQSVVTLICPVRIAMPARPLTLLDGAAEVDFDAGHGVETFVGSDAEFGVIGALEPLSGGDGETAPELQLTLHPPDGVAAATLASPDMQGAEAIFYIGALDPVTGQVIGQPFPQFVGEIDVPVWNAQMGARAVDYTIVSVFDRLLMDAEGVRASDGWHQSIWPGEKGLEFMDGTTVSLYWGGKPPPGYAYGSTAAVASSGLGAWDGF